jgi:small subunit ribosomal protein S18
VHGGLSRNQRPIGGETMKFDYKDVETLREYLDDSGKIKPRCKTKLTGAQQSRLAKAIKQARHLALLPISSRIET